VTTDQPVLTHREHRRINAVLHMIAAVFIAAMVMFAVAYAITYNFQYLAAAVMAALAAWCVSEPIKHLRDEVGSS
jgi:VIT1/CCC1 family predicted Fe2+/Mn2+ transporter